MKKYKFQIHFKSKLFFGLIFITLVPLLLLAFYNRQNAIERWNQIQKYEMKKDLDYLEANINEIIPAFDKKDIEKRKESLRKISGKLDLDFDILNITELLYSTEDNLYKIGFFKSGLPAKVYRDIVLNNKPYSFSLEKLENYEYLVGYKKIKLNEDDFIFLSIPTLYKKEKIDSEISKIDAFIFGAYSITLVFIFILGNIIFERISKPLKKLREATQKISAGDLSIKLEPEDRTEVGDLVIAFNKMISDLEESRKNLAAAEREYAWKEMAKQVAHEIKNPLTPMKLSIQHLQLLFKVNRNEFLRLFNKVSNSMVEQIETLNSIAGEFSRFARMPHRNPIKVNLVDLINSVIEIFSANVKIIFEYDKENEFLIFADYEEFKRVIINLIKNSVQAKASEIIIKLSSEDTNIILSIIDNGEGIPEEILPRIFEPNFSTKTEGMGLGLSIIKKIITELEGDISISSELNKGTEVKINLKKYNG